MAKKTDVEAKPIEEVDLGVADEPINSGIEIIDEAPAEQVETPMLTADEMAEVEERAKKEVEAEFRKELKTEALRLAKEKQRAKLRMHANKHLQGTLSDLVKIRVFIPEFSNAPWLNVDGTIYLHGETYTVERHKANSLREMMQWQRRHQNEVDGKSRNRQLGDGMFQDYVTGARSRGGTRISGEAA